jgi:hydrogenase expression/formation protein HypC
MCLAVPMKVIELLPEEKARVEREGLEAVVDVSLIEQPRVGDYLIIHAGYAIQALDLEDAEERLRLFAEIAEKENPGSEGRR